MAKVFNLTVRYKLTDKSYQCTFYTKENAKILRNYLQILFGYDVETKISSEDVYKK